jgi:VanZ family protein
MFRPAEWLQRIPLFVWQTAFWLLWLAATTLMLMPAEQLPKVDIWDKYEHSATFASLMVLAWLGYRRPLQRLAILLIAYGIVIECIQFFIPSRSFSVLDMVADATGVLPVWWLATRVKWP